jgi:hypothetical protein
VKKFAIFSLFLAAMLFFNIASTHAASPGYWAEIYDEFSYRTTNFGDDNVNVKASDFLINTLVIKGGLRFDVIDRKYFDSAREDLKSGLYFDIYGKGELLFDFLNKQWNANVFSNNEKLGGGVRLKYEQRPASYERGVYFSGEIFSEYLHLYKSIDSSKEVFYTDIKHDDVRVGFNTWSTYEKELNKKQIEEAARDMKEKVKPLLLFSELYGDFSYHTSNFATKNQSDYLILILSPKIGIATELTDKNTLSIRKLNEKLFPFSLKPGLYGIVEYVRDLRNNEWNKNPYSNNTKYGVGGRLLFSKPSEKIFKDYSEFSINVFIEQLWADYHSRALNWDIADKDLRIGLRIWWPLGEAKYTKGIQ